MRDRVAAAREREWRRCKGDSPQDVDALRYWMERHAYIQHPEHGAIKIPLRPAQSEILETWLSERYSIVLKARQIGWSTLIALYCLWLTFFWSDQLVIMLSKGEREAEKLLGKGTYAYERMPAWMKERGPRRLTKNLKKLAFSNSSVIESMPSKEDPGRSSTASLVVVDEWAFLENAEQAWASIEPIADVGGRVIGLSTANGSGDFFEQFWIKAETGVSDFKPMFYPWWANDERDDDWYETKKRGMPEWQLHQEYPSNPEEAFIKSGRPVFDTDALRKIVPVEPMQGLLEAWEHGVRAPKFRETNGPLRVWAFPQSGHAYCLGGDVAEGLEHGDYSSLHVIDIGTNEVVANWHGHIDPDLFGEEAAKLGWFYNSAFCGIEVNNHGLTTCKTMQRLDYPRMYYRRELDGRWGKGKQIQKVGWLTTASSKPLMIDELVMALRNELVLMDALTIAELRTYARDEKGRMSGSPFDDRTMSLAVANQMRKYVRLDDFKKPDDDYGTFNWHLRRVLDEDKRLRASFIGQHNHRDPAGTRAPI